ncbi:EAL domain-containing protein [Methylomonas sp. AM2-LC]|uniref:sensor domain-containing protein n=1 Tax=Methylomonas sp. AM2-LC TaxID=3153301 RepID=UPI00326554FA
MFENTLKSSAMGFATIDEQGCIVFANSALCSMLGFLNTEAAVGCQLIPHLLTQFICTNPSDFSQLLQKIEPAIMELQPIASADPVRLHIGSAESGLRLLVVDRMPKIMTISAHAKTLSHYDPMTGLGNRLLLEEVIANWQPNPPDVLSMAVIMIDLDRFKPVNDTLGHAAGDSLLKLVAKRLLSAARKQDYVIRMGGDEFLILHTIGSQPVGAVTVAKRIVNLIARPFLIDGQQVNIGASVGVAALNHGTDTVSDLLKHADLALYEAKAAGRGNFKFFEPALALRAMGRRDLEIDLRRALGLKEFFLVYQPQVNIVDGSLRGFEALIRWQCPKRGLVSPLDFISLAEVTGEIHAIGEWTLRTACAEAMTWDGDFCVAVNVSPVQFENDQFVHILRNVLVSTGLPPQRLEIEITEGLLMKDYSGAQKHLWDIQALGVGIAMDDFGTGYSSLSYLHNFPFSKIKIDQSFIRGNKSDKSLALVNAIINLGDCLGMTTVAEGVETQEQYQELADGGCMVAQGYLISKPITAQTVPTFINLIKTKER